MPPIVVVKTRHYRETALRWLTRRERESIVDRIGWAPAAGRPIVGDLFYVRLTGRGPEDGPDTVVSGTGSMAAAGEGARRVVYWFPNVIDRMRNERPVFLLAVVSRMEMESLSDKDWWSIHATARAVAAERLKLATS